MLPLNVITDLNTFYKSNYPNIRPISVNASMEKGDGRQISAIDAWALARYGSNISARAAEYTEFVRTMLKIFQKIELYFIENVRVEDDHKDAIARPQGWAGFGCLPLALAIYVSAKDGIVGSYVECGVFRGGSLACLSHACQYVGTTAYAADTFAGLPETDETGYWKQNQFLGSIDEVKKVITAVGVPEVVQYKKGLFSDTLGDIVSPVSLIFLDTDLYKSSRSALSTLSPATVPQTIIASDGVSGKHDFENGGFCPSQNEAKAVLDHFTENGQPIHAVWTGNGNMGLFRAQQMGTDLLFSSSFVWQLVVDYWGWKRFEEHVNVSERQDGLSVQIGSSVSEQQFLDFLMADALQRQIVSNTYIGHLEWLNNKLQIR
jgi:Macrocin-O-methyltransferase (TylF)